jgi:lysozyme
MNTLDLIRSHEGERQFVYDDADGTAIHSGSVVKGNPTVGVGRNLAGKGLSPDEIAYLLNNDIREVQTFLATFPWYRRLNPVRQAALTDMAFNLGTKGFAAFAHMIAAVAAKDYATAAAAMLDSKAARQLPKRYGQLAQMLKSGAWPQA